jgi:hypothetical protein
VSSFIRRFFGVSQSSLRPPGEFDRTTRLCDTPQKRRIDDDTPVNY